MATQYRCKNQQRIKDIIDKAGFNGIDYLEVSGDQKTLRIYCVNALVLPYAGTAVITGGVRVQGATLAEASPGGERVVIDGELRVTKVTAGGKVITVTVNQPGDFSAYTLRLITSCTNLQAASRLRPATVGGRLLVQGGLSQRFRLRAGFRLPARGSAGAGDQLSGERLRQLPPAAA